MDIETIPMSVRRNLLHAACVAAWSDLDVADVERELIMLLARELALGEADIAQVQRWTEAPPPDFDPYAIPSRYREPFIKTFIAVLVADGRVDPMESETVSLLQELLV